MNAPNDTADASGSAGPAGRGVAGHPRACTEIQDVLLDYMNRELGAARSELVRGHLRKCAECQAAAAAMQRTLAVLQRASRAERDRPPEALTEKRRRRMRWAAVHPVLNWVVRRHVLVSILAAALALIAAAFALWLARQAPSEPEERTLPITYGRLASDLPPVTVVTNHTPHFRRVHHP